MRPVAHLVVLFVTLEVHPLTEHQLAEHFTSQQEVVVLLQSDKSSIQRIGQAYDLLSLLLAPGEDVGINGAEACLGWVDSPLDAIQTRQKLG